MITRVLPRPYLSFIILALWLILAPNFNAGNVFLGGILAIATPLLTASFWPEPLRVQRPLTGLRLLARLIVDILIANIIVARLVLGPMARLQPHFVEVPIDIDDDFVATMLGSIIALTPGTVFIDLDRERRVLFIHALNVADPAALVTTIKTRYEAPLKETFGC